MGRGQGPPHRVRHDQGGVPQPPHPGEADGACRGRHHHDRGRRRRRLRRARRILSRGFPDPVRGAKAQPRGEMDRGPPREPDRLQPRPRRRMRAGDRLRARRHDPRLARARAPPISAPTSAPTASPRRATPRRCCPAPIACRTSISRSRCCSPTRRRPAPIAGPGRFEADFFRERLFDMAANDLGIDRVEFRRQQSRRRARDAVGACRPCSRSTRAARPTPATTSRRSTAACTISAGRRNQSCKAS